MQRATIDLTFPHQYEVEEVHDLPSRPSTIKHVYFPGGSENGGRDGLLLRMVPTDGAGEAWLGTFAAGSFTSGVTGIYACPDPDSIAVVLDGEGYYVSASNPAAWEEIKVAPIVEVRIIVDPQMLLLVDYTRISAYGEQGHIWTTERLSWDGLRITETNDQWIRGIAWDSPQQRDVEFIVDIQTGRHTGGSNPNLFAKM